MQAPSWAHLITLVTPLLHTSRIAASSKLVTSQARSIAAAVTMARLRC